MEKNIVENVKNIPEEFNAEDEIDLLELLRVIWKNKIMILIIAGVVTVAAGIKAIRMPKIYEAELTFMAESQKSSSGGLSSLAGSLPLSALGISTGSDGTTDYKTIMESRTFREEVIKNRGLYDYFIKSSKIDLSKIKDKKALPTTIDAAGWLGGNIKITRDEKTGVYKIKAEMNDKEMVSVIPQKCYDELQSYLKEKKMTKTKMNRIYVEKQLEIVNLKMSEQENEIKKIGKKYNSVSVGDEAKAVSEMTADIKKSILEKSNQVKIIQEFAGEDNMELKKAEKELQVYQNQLANLQTGGKNVPVDVIPLNDIPSLKIRMERLTRELQATAELYKMLLVQAETARIEEVKDIPVTNILDKPIEPKMPSKPNRKLIVLIGMVLGLFLGVFMAFAKEFIKNVDFKKITE